MTYTYWTTCLNAIAEAYGKRVAPGQGAALLSLHTRGLAPRAAYAALRIAQRD